MAMEFPRDARRWLQRAPDIANLILIALIGLAAARLFWLVWPEPPAPVVAPANVDSSSRAGIGQSIDVDAIASAHLFGEHRAEDDAKQNQQIEAPETHLNLVLTGIVSNQGRKRSRALIEDPQGQQDKYSAGQAIVSGVKLRAIYADRVILDRNGRLETLTLESLKNARSLQGLERTRTTPTPDRTVSGDLAEKLGDVRDKIMADPSSVGQYLRLQPARENGQLAGYRVFPGQNKTLFDQAGLKSGELVTAINGQPLDNQAASLKMLTDLVRADSATLTLQRDGQSRTLRVNFK